MIQVLAFVFALGAALYVMRQVRKPDRVFGRLFVAIMNVSHSDLTDWGLSHVRIAKNLAILDVGCGGGRTIEKLAALAPDGTVCGVDYAAGSVAASKSRNSALISSGRVKVEQASVSQLPFEADNFDLVTAIETQYYWPDQLQGMREIARVLRPGGTLMVIAETYKGGAGDVVQGPVMRLLGSTNLDVREQRELFETAGFTCIEISEEPKKGWICATGVKPRSQADV